MPEAGITVIKPSSIYTTRPVPASDQPDYSNAVALVETAHDPHALLHALLGIERTFGRVRDAENRNAARTLDLDILAYNNTVLVDDRLDLPHPRLHERLFVLEPLAEIAPGWVHPVSGQSAAALLTQHKAMLGSAPL